MKTADFLLELGVEELPAKSLLRLSNDLGEQFEGQLDAFNLSYAQIDLFATPRRLSLLVHDLQLQQSTQTKQRKGPAVGASAQAIIGFAKSCGVEENLLEKKTLKGGDYYYFSKQQTGQKAIDLLAQITSTALQKTPIAKPMRWGDKAFKFARPLDWLVMILGNQIVPADIMGLHSSNRSKGLRFADKKTLTIKNAKDYQHILLNETKIEVDFQQRRENIRQQVKKVAADNQAIAVIDEDLLTEVCALVELPLAFLGGFDRRFLSTPKEALILTMKLHQKYFHLLDDSGELLPLFIGVANGQFDDLAVIIDGNQRVIRPRLADAEFFYEQDKKHSLASRLPQLKDILFMKSLGSMRDKAERVAALSAQIAIKIGADDKAAHRAGLLCKTDLLSDMVGEFADLEGIMGGYYALYDGEENSVSIAISEHYQPKFAGDNLPRTKVGLAVAIADKLDSISGIYAIGQQPTGSKDPYALRRLALGLARIMIESKLPLDLQKLIVNALQLHHLPNEKSWQIYQFIIQRLKGYYQEKNIEGRIFASVAALETSSPYDFHLRVEALRGFADKDEAASLIEANKRIVNILKNVNEDDFADFVVHEKDFVTDFDKKLNAAIIQIENNNQADYQQKINELLALKIVIDEFFDNVLVNDDNSAVKKQRLSMIKRLRALFLSVADISYLSQ